MKGLKKGCSVILSIIIITVCFTGCFQKAYPYELTGDDRSAVLENISNYYDIEAAKIYKHDNNEYSIVYKFYENEDESNDYSVLRLDENYDIAGLYFSTAKNEAEALKDDGSIISVNKATKDNIILKAGSAENKEMVQILGLSYDAVFIYSTSLNIDDYMLDRHKSNLHTMAYQPIKPYITEQVIKEFKENTFISFRMPELLHQAIFYYQGSTYDIPVSVTYKADHPCEFYIDHYGYRLNFIRRDDLQVRFIGISFPE